MSGVYSVRPDEVEFMLEHAPFKYPTRAEADPERGWAHVMVMPAAFDWVTEADDLPSVAATAAFVMTLCNPRYADRPEVRRRGEKLAMDFYRDLHTYGLLCQCPLFGQVLYKKAQDAKNVDYLARLRARYAAYWGFHDPLAVQAQMRAQWPVDGDPYEEIKSGRRSRRGQASLWPGKLYLVTNRNRAPWKRIAGVWLFGPDHIKDLADEVAADLAPELPRMIAVQARMEGF